MRNNFDFELLEQNPAIFLSDVTGMDLKIKIFTINTGPLRVNEIVSVRSTQVVVHLLDMGKSDAAVG